MPHKHKRLKLSDEAQFNLPPTSAAKALPVKHTNGHNNDPKRKNKKRSNRSQDDDTPRAFRQLMQFQKTGKGVKSLDDGRSAKSTGPKRKRNTENETNDDSKDEEAERPALKIQPGERLGDYAARVDQALPVAGLIAKHNKGDGPGEQRITKHNKKLQRLVNNWKAEEAKRIEKKEDEWDDAEEDEDENDAIWETNAPDVTNGKSGKKSKRGRRSSDNEDPWAQLKKKRDKPKGIFDVAQAPPQFTKMPKEFKIKDGARVNVNNVPNTGSLRHQEMLSETRQDVIARYRQMMQAKRGEA